MRRRYSTQDFPDFLPAYSEHVNQRNRQAAEYSPPTVHTKNRAGPANPESIRISGCGEVRDSYHVVYNELQSGRDDVRTFYEHLLTFQKYYIPDFTVMERRTSATLAGLSLTI